MGIVHGCLFAVALQSSQLGLHLWDYLKSEFESRELSKSQALHGTSNKGIVF